MNTLILIVLVFIGFLALIRVLVWISGKLKTGKSIPPFSGELGTRIQKGEKLLLYFYTPSCGACKAMTPVVDEMMRKNNHVYKINLMKNNDIGKIFGIMGTPATIIVNKSKIDQYILGARSRKFLLGLIV